MIKLASRDLLEQLKLQTEQLLKEFFAKVCMPQESILVVGCSTSEVLGQHIGQGGTIQVAQVILSSLLASVQERDIFLAIQCCEHLNRALVVEKNCQMRYNLEQVSAYPIATAGGSMAACAMQLYKQPVLVESIQAQAGIDIGQTLIGMHLQKVAVPIRLEITKIGQAQLTCAYTRPKLIGGPRAVYSPQ